MGEENHFPQSDLRIWFTIMVQGPGTWLECSVPEKFEIEYRSFGSPVSLSAAFLTLASSFPDAETSPE